MKTKITVDKVRVKHLVDDNPDLSFLESGNKDDAIRLTNYGNTWEMLGIQAVAEVSYPLNSKGDRRIECFSSGGLWGIESDSDDDYIKEIEQGQLNDLKEHLTFFGIDVTDFEAKIQ